MTLFYIDPGTGMIIVQLIVAAFASIAAFSKKIRDKIKSFFKRKWDILVYSLTHQGLLSIKTIWFSVIDMIYKIHFEYIKD